MPFIEVSGVSKSFAAKGGARRVLQQVSLSVERGEFVAIVGAMGSGKSTLLSIMAGLTAPDAGSILIDGEPLRDIRRDAAVLWQATQILVATSLDSHRSIPWPEDIRAALVSFQEAPHAHHPAA